MLDVYSYTGGFALTAAAGEAMSVTAVDSSATALELSAESAARQAVGRCVQRFNELDSGWICTIEREDIGDYIHDLVTGHGLAWDEDYLEDADW